MGARILGIILSTLLATACVENPRPADPPQASTPTVAIASIYKDPKAFDRHALRVRGILNQCFGFECSLCEGATGQGACLRVEFDEVMQSHTMEAALRLSEVTVEGRYDWICDMASYSKDPRYFDQTKTTQEIVVCTDRATNFIVTRVLAVHRRWPATDPTLNHGRGDPLEAAPAAWGDEVVAAAKKGDVSPYPDLYTPANIGKGYVVLRRPGKDDAVILCVCPGAECAGRWPTHTSHLIPTPANPYRCAQAVRIGGAWRFPPVFN